MMMAGTSVRECRVSGVRKAAVAAALGAFVAVLTAAGFLWADIPPVPAGPVDHLTTAVTAGRNVLGVEHNRQSATGSDMSFHLSLTGLDELPPLMRKQPYLIWAGLNTEMEVHWQLALSDSCSIEWGLDTSYSLGNAETGEYGDDHQHEYTITGLTPGTLYYYRVTAGTEEYTGAFRAAPPGDETQVKFFAYGDCRTYPAHHNQVAEGVVSAYTADAGLHTMILSVGDLVSDGDVEVYWDSEFFNSNYSYIRQMMAELPYQACMGNHEGSGVLFQKYLPYPFVAGRYWSFDYGPAHFAVVDQYVPYTSGSPQHTWLQGDLASSARPWKVIILHEPGWSAGGHSNNTDVQNHIQPLCEAYDVALLFAGHNHYYARAVVNGVQHVTTGGGGAPLYDPNPAADSVVAVSKSYHFCTVEIDGSLLHFEAIDTAGSIIDSFTVVGPDAGILHRPSHRDALVLDPAAPSPFTTSTGVSFTAPVEAEAVLSVYDIAGRKVRSLFRGPVGARRRTVVWDGKNDLGSPVGPGAYVLRLDAGGMSVTRKVVKLK
jgi:hypothetical protein